MQVDHLLNTIVESTHLNINMCKFESSQKMKADCCRLIPRKHTENVVLLLVYNCTQLITRPTRITDHSASLLDNIYTSNFKIPLQPRIPLSDLSDHLPTFGMIKFSYLKQKQLPVTRRHNYKNLDRYAFLHGLTDALDMLPVNNGNPCQVVNNLHSIF